jgi:hypothetical protein
MDKKRPASMLISAILASIIFIIIANSFMNLWGNSFTTLTAAKTATQAQAYSDIISEKKKLEGIEAEEVTTKTKLSEITGNKADDEWFYTYEIENEMEDDDGNIFKVASIKIYKDDEIGPRYSTEIPLSSLGSNLGEFGSNDKGYYWKLPNGLIFQWGDNTGQQSQYSKKIYSFPIPYKSNVFMIATEPKGYIGVKANKTAHSASVENLKQFSLYVGEYRNMYWFAIGN